MTAIPYAFFTSAYPPGTYSIEVEDLTGGGGSVVCPITIVADTTFFELPDSTSGGSAAAWPTSSIVRLVLASLQANAPYGGSWSATWEHTEQGAGVRFINSLQNTNFVVPPSSGTAMPLTWIGWDNTTQDTEFPDYFRVPYGCWYPRTVLQDMGDTATPAQVYSAGPTANGSFHTVQHDDGTRARWYRYMLDGSEMGGVDGGRMMTSRLTDTWRTDWATDTGLASTDAYAAFDAVDGWWYRTLDGTPFKIIRSIYEPASSITGRKVFVFPDANADVSMPVAMDGWRARTSPNVNVTRAGRRVLDFCCTDYVAS